MAAEYKNILINALVNLGDVVLTTAACDLIKQHFPDAKITMLVKGVVKDAVIDNPVVDDVIAFEYTARKNSLGKMYEVIKEIRRRKFDLAISFDRKLRPALITLAAGIPRRVCPTKIFEQQKSRVPLLYTDVVKIDYDLFSKLQAENFQEIVRRFFKIEGQGKPHFPKKNSPNAENLLSRISPDKIKIALCVKGTFPLKTYPKKYFAEVVNSLRQKYNAAFFIIGAPNDRPYADEVIAEIGGEVSNFCGETSLNDLAEIFRRADLLITVDTGAMHIAATTGIKTVAFFGCTSPVRYSPINENSVVLSSREPCCPCSVREKACPSYPAPNCLYNVKPSEIVDAAVKFLG